MTSATSNFEVHDDGLLAELARPLMHDFNNFLNTLLLQIAVLDHRLPGEFREELAPLRREAKAMAELIRQWQRYRKAPISQESPSDLNGILEDVVAAYRATGAEIELTLASERTPVAAPAKELRRLCWLLLADAVAAVKERPAGRIRIRIEPAAGQVLLAIQDNREGVSSEDIAAWFEARASGHALERAASQAIIRSLRGRIEAEAKSGEMLTVRVSLPAAT
jgi:C4-dicarboxylate-specific signal transduction histidine kinase